MEQRKGGLTVQQGAFLGAGMLTVSGAALFYRQKKTLPFKIAYFLSWPVLGTAVLTTFAPDKTRMEQELKSRGLDPKRLEQNRYMTELQMARLKAVANHADK